MGRFWGRIGGRRRAVTAGGAVLAVLMGLAAVVMVSGSSHAQPTTAERCHSITTASELRRTEVTGTGPTVAVIGDSYSMGLGLDDPGGSWPSRLSGTVVVDGFSGSGFSDAASPCRDEAYYHRVSRALAADPTLVVLQGGLNEYDVPGTEIRTGLSAALHELEGQRVVMVGPPMAPRRAYAVDRVDDLLARVAAHHHVPYVRTSSWALTYLPDQLHLTEAGHAAFGDGVAQALAGLGEVAPLR